MIELGPARFASTCGLGWTTPGLWGTLVGARSSAGPGLADWPAGLAFAGVVVFDSPMEGKSESSISSAMSYCLSVRQHGRRQDNTIYASEVVRCK